MEPLRIFTVSLAGIKKHKAYGVFDGERLVVTHIVPIAGAFGTWKKPLIDEIVKRRSEGYVCIVEEKSDHIARHASQFCFEDMDLDSGRSNLYLALDWYFPMMEMGNIVIGTEFQQFVIRSGGEGQKIEKNQDEKGRLVYSVNWDAINGGHRALLLCVVAAMVEPVSDRYVNEMLEAWIPLDRLDDPLATFKAIARAATKGA